MEVRRLEEASGDACRRSGAGSGIAPRAYVFLWVRSCCCVPEKQRSEGGDAVVRTCSAEIHCSARCDCSRTVRALSSLSVVFLSCSWVDGTRISLYFGILE